MVTAPTAIIDACVLYSAPIRDLVVRLAQAGLLQARWSDEIHEEWMRNLLKNNPRVSRERLGRTRFLMDAAIRDSLVTGHSQLVDSLTLPDPDDRHVLAAAIHSGAGLIVTFNLMDFPLESVAPHGVEQGLRTTFSCVFEGFSRELSSNYIINTNCNALYSPITYRKVATM